MTTSLVIFHHQAFNTCDTVKGLLQEVVLVHSSLLLTSFPLPLHPTNAHLFSLTSGHFTQVVWESSRELGVGISKEDDLRSAYIVCFYFPPGNIRGEYTKQVPPPRVNNL
ncbi:unnamed protein product [Protopolystoma xenopodis]|uniref:SCP domain-containing protein n=1 Tax=Protopolystoma xenopodis TaxID=117903 RepID=A0A3S5AWV1_9PLAT|nr:unnamed protein product [Protopolystoma xenopodis]